MVPADLNVPQALCPRLKLLPLQPQLSQHPPDLVRPRRGGGLEVLEVEDEDVGTADADPVAEDLKPLAGENDRGESKLIGGRKSILHCRNCDNNSSKNISSKNKKSKKSNSSRSSFL